MKTITYLLLLFRPIRLHKWIQLEDIKDEIPKAENLSKSVYDYLKVAFGMGWIFKFIDWQKTVQMLTLANYMSRPKNNKLPILNSKNKDNHPTPWNYKGRTWNYWLHLLAKEYGWSIKYIEDLDVDIALALLQEIFTEEQLDREFHWGMSETAYSYDQNTKRSTFNPLPRPDWMLPVVDESILKPTKMLAAYVPVGLIITADEILKSQTLKP